MNTAICSINQRAYPAEDLTPLSAIRPQIGNCIRAAHPELRGDSLISQEALGIFRADYVRGVLREDIGAISELEHDVVRSLQEHEVLASNINVNYETSKTFGERLSDSIAEFGGSWRFIIGFGGFLAVWVGVNTLLLRGDKSLDPYPFIFLNLILSCIAALQAPVIMMSQNRQSAKDRLQADHDYKVNLKAELEVRHLHEKVDYLLTQQSQRLFDLQEMQIELMEELAAHARAKKA